jgi:Tfp pilus assembly protein PilX
LRKQDGLALLMAMLIVVIATTVAVSIVNLRFAKPRISA